MKILLINPNRFLQPPVPPIGLEYIAAALLRAGHSVRMLDLAFSREPSVEIDRAVAAFQPDLAGFTIRNVDSVIFPRNEFLLAGLPQLVARLRERQGLPVMIGGAGLMANPGGLLDYLGADYAVSGPGEAAVVELVQALSQGRREKRIWQGLVRPSTACRRLISETDYAAYYQAGGMAGFETHKGCSSSCVYCLEADRAVAFRPVGDVLAEIRELMQAGFSRFHLCDAEFNEDLDHALEFCGALKQEKLSLEWSAYMKPANYNQKLFRLMRDTGVRLITLTVDSFRKCPLYWSDAEKMIFNARANGIRIAVDFLTGFPYEENELLIWCLDFFRRLQPDRLTVNTHIRLYKGLQITKIIARDRALQTRLLGSLDDGEMILPRFYNQVDQDYLRSLIADDPLFHLEGDEAGVNATRP